MSVSATLPVIQKSAIGLRITLNVVKGGDPVDVSGATTATLYIRKPDGTTISGTLVLQGSEVATYDTIVTDFDQAGKFYLQGHFALPGGFTGKTKIYPVIVLANLN